MYIVFVCLFSQGLTSLLTLKVHIRDTCQYDTYTKRIRPVIDKPLQAVLNSHEATSEPVNTTHLGQLQTKYSSGNTPTWTPSIQYEYNHNLIHLIKIYVQLKNLTASLGQGEVVTY